MSIQSELAQEAKCYCFNDATERAVVVYLLLSKTGLLNMTPSQLAVAAKAYSYDLDTWKKIVAYLLAVDAGLQGDTPKQLADAAKCYCFDEGTWKKVVAFLLASGGSGGPCPQDMQIAWTPTNLKLGEGLGFTAFGDISGWLTGIFDQVNSLGGFDIENQASLTSFSSPNLVSIDSNSTNGGYFALTANSGLTSASLPLLAVIGGNFSITQNNLLATIDLSSLVTAKNSITIAQNNALANLDLPSLVTCSGGLAVKSNAILTTLSIPNYVPTNGDTQDFTGNSLNAASVNQILARCVANAGYVTGIVTILGGGNSAPSGQGIADKATLIGRGCTVTTN